MNRPTALAGALLAAALAAPMSLVAPSAAGAELTMGIASEPTSMDPHFHNLTPNNSMLSHVFDRLVHQDEKQNLVPGLAVSWRAIDATTWEFELREGVTFHDGSPFTADDVIFTFERAPDVEGSPSSFGLYTKGKTLKKIDDHTLHIETEEPWPLMPQDVSNIMIVSSENGEGARTEDYNSGAAAIGTGAYEFVEYVPGDRIVVSRNETWWGNKPEWTKVTFKPIKSGPTRVAALLAGDVDIIEQTPTVDIERLESEPGVNLSQGISNRVIYLHLDHDRDDSPFVKAKDGSAITNPLKDRRVRTAISMAIQRDAIVERVMEGLAVKAGQLLPEGFFGVSEKLEPVEYDPEGAKALLAEAGVPDGFRLTLHGPNDRYVNDARIAEAIGQMLTRIGIETEVVTMPRSVYFKRASRGGPDGTPEFSFILVGWGSGTGEASSPLRSLIHTWDADAGYGASNRGRYSNPEVDAMIEKALVTIDDAERAELLARATEIAIEDVAIIPLHYQVNTWASRTGIAYKPRTDENTVAYSTYSE